MLVAMWLRLLAVHGGSWRRLLQHWRLVVNVGDSGRGVRWRGLLLCGSVHVGVHGRLLSMRRGWVPRGTLLHVHAGISSIGSRLSLLLLVLLLLSSLSTLL